MTGPLIVGPDSFEVTVALHYGETGTLTAEDHILLDSGHDYSAIRTAVDQSIDKLLDAACIRDGEPSWRRSTLRRLGLRRAARS